MKKIYMIELKFYFKESNSKEYQMADCGELPRVYKNKNRAINAAQRSVRFYQTEFGYKLLMQTPYYLGIDKSCLYAARLKRDEDDMRVEFRVYKQLTWD